CYNSWQLLKGSWTKRYKELLKKVTENDSKQYKALSYVEDSVWQTLYQQRYVEENDPLKQSLFDWCTKKFVGDDDEFDTSMIIDEVKALEKKEVKTIRDSLRIMSAKFLMAFSVLTHTQKCVLKLAVSDIINLNTTKYFREYLLHLDVDKQQELSALQPPSLLSEEETKAIKATFAEHKKALFVDKMPILCDTTQGKKGQIGYVMTVMKNKFVEWQREGGDDDDEEEEEESTRKKRKRSFELDESDVVQIVKEILNALFADTLLRWKSGEKTTESCKKMKIQNEMSSSVKGSCRNIMGRRSDIILYNSKKVPLCLSEVKDGRSTTETTSQESKSIRCTKSLQVYNTCLSGSSSIWSLDWCGTRGYIYHLKRHEEVDVVLPGKTLSIPKTKEELDDLESTLLALYELKNFLVEYEGSLKEDFDANHDEGYIFHTP
ncbi:hypothetical protein A0J61_08456, partial [Choanephora cucurbitarum]